ncbi:MAG: LON peptidase substrate-binding domain-containing protein [Steroidobacteraceae bacterium]
MSERIALFPLRTVLFPQAVLPLRIFETRYVDMVRRCMREQSGFGVVLIRDGAEVGGLTAIADVGCFARIVDFDAMPDGLLGITAQGERRFRILQRDVQKDGLNLADVEWLDEQGAGLASDQFVELREILARALAELGDSYPCGAHRMNDALWVGSQLGQLLPVSAGFRQNLLEISEATERLGFLDAARAAGDTH